MTVSILGAGNVGLALARALLRAEGQGRAFAFTRLVRG